MKIALVNDQDLAVEQLRRIVTSRPEHSIAWVARTGADAVAQCAQLRPDVILMDLLMPVMDGVEATRRIMAATPCPIVIVTANCGAGSWRVFEAMGHGAIDAMEMPSGGTANNGAAALLAKLALIAPRGSLSSASGAPFVVPKAVRSFSPRETLVAIGASAGGPAALATILGQLSRDFPAPMTVVQHVDAKFAPGMAEWLNTTSALQVRVARENDPVEPGAVLLAATNDHLTLKDGGRLGYASEPREAPYRPSVDVFFGAVAMHWPGRVIGVLLTGMGRDGAVGLKVLRNRGHLTLAQDEATSAVYGMPKAAAQLDAATEILPLPQIAPRLTQAVSKP